MWCYEVAVGHGRGEGVGVHQGTSVQGLGAVIIVDTLESVARARLVEHGHDWLCLAKHRGVMVERWHGRLASGSAEMAW